MIHQLRRAFQRFRDLFGKPNSQAWGTAHVLPDTNLALHWKRLDEIDWLAVTGASRVRLEIAPIFLRELEHQKVSHRSKKLRDRAARTIQWLASMLEQGGQVQIRPDVEVSFIDHEPRIDLVAHRLSERLADDLLIASALELARASRGRVGIATGDIGLRAKIKARSELTAYIPPETARLPEEVDPDQKELSDLRATVARMQAQRPVLRVAHAGEAPFHEINPRAPLQPVETLASVQARFPLKSSAERKGMALTGMPVVNSNDAYNQRVQRFWNEWASYERAYNAFAEFLQRSFVAEFQLWNDGGKPATDIDVYVTLPDGVIAIAEDELPKIPRKPKEPSERVSFLDPLANARHLDVPLFNPPRDGDARVIDQGRRIRFSAERLKHDFHLDLEKVVIAFAAGKPPFSFEAEYKVSCAETAAASGKLRFVVKDPSTN